MRNVNSCIQPHAENTWKTQKEVAENNAKATIQNSANILRPQGNVTKIGASEYISRAQGASKPQVHNCHPGTKYNSSNNKSTTCLIATQNLAYNRPHPTLVNTPHPAYNSHSPCTLTNSLPHPNPYAISHHQSGYRSTVPKSPTTPFYPLYNQLILYSYTIPSSVSNI